ncbi:MAG TPA: PsiF family protein [Hyphomicrobiaceae bacterium]|nr:PsiF family protein [Hyphomicrobiaceae bacterium]
MRLAVTAAIAAIAGSTFISLATAQTPPKPRTAESIQCSAEADQKGLKGKERQKFRKACIAAAKKKKGSAA